MYYKVINTPAFKTAAKWLAPTTYECNYYEEDLEDARLLRYTGTCTWIRHKPSFISWSESETDGENNFLWIYAIPGAGKTVLASYLIDTLSETKESELLKPLYFFFKNNDAQKNTALAAARALVHQVLQFGNLACRTVTLDDISSHMASSGQSRALSFRSLWNLFCKACSRYPSLIIIIDALDECSDVSFVIKGLFELLKVAKVKIAVTSRHEPEPRKQLNSLPCIEAGPEEVCDDIRAFVNFSVHTSTKLSNTLVRGRVMRILNSRNKGMFLWAVLMIKELDAKATFHEIEDALSTVPEELSQVYELILLRLLRTLRPSEKEFCCRLLKWITLAARPLQLGELRAAIEVEYSVKSGDIRSSPGLLYTESDMAYICGSLITVRRGALELVHLSAKEFLQTLQPSCELGPKLSSFRVDPEENAQIAAYCTMYLEHHYFAYKSPPDKNIMQWEGGSPFLEYACFNWLKHAAAVSWAAVQRCEHIMSPFLQNRSSFNWVELCLYLDKQSMAQLQADLIALLDWFDSEAWSGDEIVSPVRSW